MKLDPKEIDARINLSLGLIKTQEELLRTQRRALQAQQDRIDASYQSLVDIQKKVEDTRIGVLELMESAKAEFQSLRGDSTKKYELLNGWTLHIQTVFKKELEKIKASQSTNMATIRGEMVTIRSSLHNGIVKLESEIVGAFEKE